MCLGHSFIHRLATFCDKEGKPNLGLDPDLQLIQFHGLGGKYVSDLQSDLPVVDGGHPQLVCIDIASNDLDASGAQPHLLAMEVFRFAQQLVAHHKVKSVVIMEVLFRTEVGRFATSSQSRFMAAAHRYNNVIKSLVNKQARHNQSVYFWHHKGLVHDWQQYICDGVHLNKAGMHKYFTSFRRCIIRHAHKLH
jgi:lysophospholipase L1-like esterase